MQVGVREAARLLAVSEKSVYRWIKSGQLPTYLINEQYRFNRAELLEWATARKINVSPEIFDEPGESGRTILPEVANALEAGGIHYRVAGTDTSSGLKAVVDLMPLPDDVDHGFLHQVLLARESLGLTGVGDGIAIPHVRNPIVLHVPRPTITLCFLEHPIDFGAIDGLPVDTVFTILSPGVRTHLHILSRLIYTLRDPRVRRLLARQAPRPEILDAMRTFEAKATPETGAS
jgi:PTS system nitrogen regulatory IIA component